MENLVLIIIYFRKKFEQLEFIGIDNEISNVKKL